MLVKTNESHPFLRAVRVLLLAVPALCFALSAKAQQDPAYVHYWMMQPQYNPAAVGHQDQMNITGSVQMHATGFEDAGSTMYAAADAAFRIGKTRHGLGAIFQKDEIGLFSHQHFALQYAYRLKLFGGFLGIGVQADMLSEKIDGGKVDLIDSNDPAFPTSEMAGSKFDLSAGLHYLRGPLTVGFAALHLTQPTVEIGETNEYHVKMCFNLNAEYNIKLRNPLYSLAPTVMMRYDGTDYRADITLRTEWEREKKRFYGGVAYSPLHSVAAFLGGTVFGVTIGYSYEYFTSGMGIGSGNHEIMLGYKLDLNFTKKGKNLHKSVRFL